MSTTSELLCHGLPEEFQVYLQQVMDLKYFVLTNELSVSRLDKVINQPCVDGLIHVHLPSVGVLENPSEQMTHAVATGRLMDMSDFIRDTAKWL